MKKHLKKNTLKLMQRGGNCSSYYQAHVDPTIKQKVSFELPTVITANLIEQANSASTTAYDNTLVATELATSDKLKTADEKSLGTAVGSHHVITPYQASTPASQHNNDMSLPILVGAPSTNNKTQKSSPTLQPTVTQLNAAKNVLDDFIKKITKIELLCTEIYNNIIIKSNDIANFYNDASYSAIYNNIESGFITTYKKKLDKNISNLSEILTTINTTYIFFHTPLNIPTTVTFTNINQQMLDKYIMLRNQAFNLYNNMYQCIKLCSYKVCFLLIFAVLYCYNCITQPEIDNLYISMPSINTADVSVKNIKFNSLIDYKNAVLNNKKDEYIDALNSASSLINEMVVQLSKIFTDMLIIINDVITFMDNEYVKSVYVNINGQTIAKFAIYGNNPHVIINKIINDLNNITIYINTKTKTNTKPNHIVKLVINLYNNYNLLLDYNQTIHTASNTSPENASNPFEDDKFAADPKNIANANNAVPFFNNSLPSSANPFALSYNQLPPPEGVAKSDKENAIQVTGGSRHKKSSLERRNTTHKTRKTHNTYKNHNTRKTHNTTKTQHTKNAKTQHTKNAKTQNAKTQKSHKNNT